MSFPPENMNLPPEKKPPEPIGSSDQWVDEHGDQLYRVALARVGDRDAAEDLVQETFLAAWKGREAFDGRSALATWLVAILKRKVADHFRRTGREAKLEEQQEHNAMFNRHSHWSQRPGRLASAPESAAENEEFWEVMATCMEGLPSPLAQAFHLRELEATSSTETSKLLGITRKNLSVRLHRARLLLRRCLEERWISSKRKQGEVNHDETLPPAIDSHLQMRSSDGIPQRFVRPPPNG